MPRSIVFMLVAVWLAVGLAQAQDPNPKAKGDNDPWKSIELRNKQIELNAREAQFDYEMKLRNLDLESKRLDLVQKQKAMENPPPAGMGSKCGMMRPGHRGPPVHLIGLVMLVCGLIHILLAIWVYQDLRKRNAGSGIWIVITLLAGICGAVPYILTRIGDQKTT